MRIKLKRLIIAILSFLILADLAFASDFYRPWRHSSNALILDAYELNAINWKEVIKNKRIAGFIGKASDGLTAEYCADRKTICGAKWRKYAVTKELYHTRRHLAKALGLKWGAYHLGRAKNPEQQALHFLKFANPQKDEAIILDIESIEDDRFMNLEEAEKFAKYIYKKIGRYPMLYVNHKSAGFIADNRKEYPLLSRLKLWYARYKDDIRDVFPMGNWDGYTLWQFAYGGNCSKKSCPYRVNGTPRDIDVNVATVSVAEIKKAWPFDGLVAEKPYEDEVMVMAKLAGNKIEYPEEEKHSDFVIDVDYTRPNISNEHTNIATGAIYPVLNTKSVECDREYSELDSDMVANCIPN